LIMKLREVGGQKAYPGKLHSPYQRNKIMLKIRSKGGGSGGVGTRKQKVDTDKTLGDPCAFLTAANEDPKKTKRSRGERAHDGDPPSQYWKKRTIN